MHLPLDKSHFITGRRLQPDFVQGELFPYSNQIAARPRKERSYTELIFPQLSREKLQPLSSLALAHVGDGIYELLARTYVVRHGGNLVCAAAQARAARIIAPLLEPEEAEVFRRGRNSHPHTVPKNQKPEDYALATGVEALFGWLYLNGRQHRVCQLFERIVEEEEKRRNAQ